MSDVLEVETCLVYSVQIDGRTAYFQDDWFNWLDGWMAEWIADKKMDDIYDAYERCLD